MSSSAKDYYENQQVQLYNERMARLEKLGNHVILTAIEDMDRYMDYANIDDMHLTRREYNAFNNVRKLIKELLRESPKDAPKAD